MTFSKCEKKSECVAVSIAVSVVLGIVAIVLQATGMIGVNDFNVIALLGIAVFYSAVTLITSAVGGARYGGKTVLNALLAGIFGTIASGAVILLRGGAFSTVGYAVIVGILAAFAVLMFCSMVCFIKLYQYGDE